MKKLAFFAAAFIVWSALGCAGASAGKGAGTGAGASARQGVDASDASNTGSARSPQRAPRALTSATAALSPPRPAETSPSTGSTATDTDISSVKLWTTLPVIALRSPTHVRIATSLEHLEIARRAAPLRPEVYYNEGILLQEYATSFEGAEIDAARARAIEVLQIFVRLADQSKELATEVNLAQERLATLRGPVCALGAEKTELERIREREARKQDQAREEAEAAEKDDTKPPPEAHSGDKSEKKP